MIAGKTISRVGARKRARVEPQRSVRRRYSVASTRFRCGLLTLLVERGSLPQAIPKQLVGVIDPRCIARLVIVALMKDWLDLVLTAITWGLAASIIVVAASIIVVFYRLEAVRRQQSALSNLVYRLINRRAGRALDVFPSA